MKELEERRARVERRRQTLLTRGASMQGKQFNFQLKKLETEQEPKNEKKESAPNLDSFLVSPYSSSLLRPIKVRNSGVFKEKILEEAVEEEENLDLE